MAVAVRIINEDGDVLNLSANDDNPNNYSVVHAALIVTATPGWQAVIRRRSRSLRRYR
jgi:hypothetical protein